MKSTKALQLGMNPSTASGRLIKDLLFGFVKEAGYVCLHCGGELTRDTFSVEHIKPWMHSDDPKKMYFDLENISFSHLKCNMEKSRRSKIYSTDEDRKKAVSEQTSKRYYEVPVEVRKKKRREKYKRSGY